MVDAQIVEAVKRYLAVLPQYGVHPSRAILYGSFARGENHEWSDIDLIVVAPEFDDLHDRETLFQLWHATGDADNRIEPIACGERQWIEDDGTPILEIARQEGIEIAA